MFLRTVSHFKFFPKPSFHIPTYSKLHNVQLPHYPSLRLFVTDAEILQKFKNSQFNRISLPEPRTSELISAINNKNYQKAKFLVEQDQVNVNGHNRGVFYEKKQMYIIWKLS